MDKGGVAVDLATISVAGAAVLFAAEHVHTGRKNFIERHLGFSPDSGEDYFFPTIGAAVSRYLETNKDVGWQDWEDPGVTVRCGHSEFDLRYWPLADVGFCAATVCF